MNRSIWRRLAAARIVAAVLAFAVLGLVAGNGCKGGSRDAISRILADPAAFLQRDVTVAGRVTRVLDPTGGLLNLAAYQVDDGSGKIWVVSRRGAPRQGQEVGLKGRIRQDMNLGVGGELLVGAVVNEIDRRER